MKVFGEKRNFIFCIVGICCAILIIVVFNLYVTNDKTITDEENFFNNIENNNYSENNELNNNIENNELKEEKLLTIHVARSC